ncbi:hypothetical protein [Rhodanobacter sp. Root561]|uniref:hypothetical protein n=1 Tax=Rhodanobacter sp. Root561 TaxID=1736560 RepID=UPI001F3AA259|nr:hypothetical protein [Rhodanobacter sp. Root561]
MHLLLTLGEERALSRLMHTFSRNYAALFNAASGELADVTFSCDTGMRISFAKEDDDVYE